MHLDRYISKSRILDIQSNTFEGALMELLQTCPLQNKQEVLKGLVEQEATMTSYLGNGVLLPHMRIQMNRPYVFAIGRCRLGLKNGGDTHDEVRLIFLILASENEDSYLNVLASLARIFQNEKLLEEVIASETLDIFKQRVVIAFGGDTALIDSKGNRFNQQLLRAAIKIAKQGKCDSIFVFADTFSGAVDCGPALKDFKTILVTQRATEVSVSGKHYIVPVRLFSHNRLSQLRSAIVICLTHGILSPDERLCCLGGIPHSNQFDSVVVIEVEKEMQSVFNNPKDILPDGVKPEVLERLLAIATELAVEGREGRPVGCLFVLGDVQRLKPFIKPLVLNPFYGYKAEERNVLNPFMDETIKEFSSIDGAFVIGGDGLLESAGSMIYASDMKQHLPSGLGTRHATALGISMAVDCVAITVSASTGQVTLFRRGQMLPLI
ncbi:MAG: hypothetical protein A2Y14_00525 [Verrucomicrobia bacterium GWF2_51_19]|nr:MAG: hypothetical protein A2Y14_00525 [Verrucomicrobia bacterium GWF2_51_19]HCJ11534.1 hypothetical protein [Opitutae bacterium]